MKTEKAAQTILALILREQGRDIAELPVEEREQHVAELSAVISRVALAGRKAPCDRSDT